MSSSIVFENVSLDIPIYDGKNISLKKKIVNYATGGRLATDSKVCRVKALNRINLSIERGDRVALLGHNGAGKSTFLKLLASIYYPTDGKIEVNGSLSTLFEVGLGMDPEMNGIDNIITRGLLYGIKKAEIMSKIPEIVEFTELGEFINLPVRTYSNGMMLRLAFAISTIVRPQILLLDEIIGAGDASFLEKAQKRIGDMIDSSDIMVLASHSNEILSRLCNRGLVFKHGEVVYDANIEDAIKYYNECY
ncbi:ABC transporter ATP-binding protein [Vibrio crassostreae]|uniref:ABC transporter ATP-binding protein n=1 Tax=Vibrio crassostreae TaxID=246167 RepID=UPI001048DBA2|nr:ABC transporter ATP-binding protein [Vibrio crassostreae]TCV12747.1 ABC-2 type transport system ATP-binding protein/lipopolysaccharide transport system ATP-binding protein [Vibrio crassostreae]